MTTYDDILDALDKDGAEVDLEDGRTLRLTIGHDPDSQVNDYDCYGEATYAYRYLYGESKTPRPAHFDGNAEKIEVDRGLWVWWQPPRGEMAWIDPETGKVALRGSAAFEKNRSDIIDLLRYGFTFVTVEVTEGEDAYHRPIVVDVASLSGIDSLENGYLREVVGDLLAEVGITEEGEEQ